MSFSSDRLVKEHDLIEQMLAVLNKAADRLEAGEKVPAEVFLQAADYIRNFADHTHHAKEEDILFKLMAERGIPAESGPIGVMLTEHEHGRHFNSEMEKAAKRLQNGDASAKPEIISNARNYARLLTDHIFKENNILYPMGNRVFSPEDQQWLEQEFEKVDTEKIGKTVHEKYEKMVSDLEAQFKTDNE